MGRSRRQRVCGGRPRAHGDQDEHPRAWGSGRALGKVAQRHTALSVTAVPSRRTPWRDGRKPCHSPRLPPPAVPPETVALAICQSRYLVNH
jgi:hypothetical protein